MVATYNPPDLVAGDTWPSMSFTYTDTDTGAAQNFDAGSVALAQLRSPSGDQLLHTWSSTLGNATVFANVVTLARIDPNITAAFSSYAALRFQMQVTSPNPDAGVLTQLSGTMRILPDYAK